MANEKILSELINESELCWKQSADRLMMKTAPLHRQVGYNLMAHPELVDFGTLGLRNHMIRRILEGGVGL